MSRGITVIGATGFVGAAVIRQLMSATFSPVHILVRDRAKLPPNLPSHFRMFTGDLNNLPVDVFPETSFSLIHLATKQIDNDGSGFDENNVAGTTQLMASLPPSARAVIYGSSASVYGQGAKTGISESVALAPETPLACSRLAAERIIFNAAQAGGLSAYCLRPRFLFGPGDRHTLPGLTRMVRRGIQPGNGSQLHSVINVEDYASVILSLAARVADGERMALNTAYREPLPFGRIIEFICRANRLRAPRIHIPVSETLTRRLRRAPFSVTRALATKLELFGLSQWLNTGLLISIIGDSILGHGPLRALEGAA
ncbi:MAG: NAD-dependent epimerase/dehydratase family protein [Bryobacteraceae bacterium]